MCNADGKWWFRHDWDEWQSNKQPLTRYNHLTSRNQHIGFFVEQHRKCKRCSKVETETSEHTI